MSHINYAFNPEDDALPRDKMKLRNIASTKYSGDWPSIPHSHSYAELFYIVDGEGQFQINDKLFPVQAHQLVVVNPNVIHTEVSFESHPLEYIVLGIEGLEFTISDAAEGSFCIYTFKEDNDVLVCMRKILREMAELRVEFPDTLPGLHGYYRCTADAQRQCFGCADPLPPACQPPVCNGKALH